MYSHSSNTDGYGCVEASEHTTHTFIGDCLKLHLKAYFPNREQNATQQSGLTLLYGVECFLLMPNNWKYMM